MKPWLERLLDLETLLGSPDPRRDISAYHDMPYAIFHYPPEDEYAFRRELSLLVTRLQTSRGKRVLRVSMAELLDQAVTAVATWEDLFAAERSVGLEETQQTVHHILAEASPLTDWVVRALPQEQDPTRDVVFLWRTGSLFPFYRTFALLEQLKGLIQVPTILCYPGTLDGPAGLRFMGVLDAEHNYRPKIF